MRGTHRKLGLLLAGAASCVSLIPGAGIANAAFPGSNGLIVFERDGDIWMVSPDGSYERRLTDDPARDAEPMFSADGRRIIFESERDGNTELYVMNADGTNLRNGTQNPARDEDPAFAADGNRIAFVSSRDQATSVHHGDMDLFVGDLTGGPALRLTDGGVILAAADPVWSPVGERIAFNLVFDSSIILGVDPDGSDYTPITHSSTYGDQDFSPSWSPDGTQLVYSTFYSGTSLRIVDADGGNDHEILADRWLFSPVWSPDGTRILFLGGPSSNSLDLYTISANGGDPEIVKSSPGTDEDNPDWGVFASPAATVPPVVSGEAHEDVALRASVGSWSGTAPFEYAYQWLRCPVGDATRSFEVAPAGDGYARATGTSYPPGTVSVADFAATSFAGRSGAAGSFNTDTLFLRFDTSSLPDAGVVVAARIEFAVTSRGSADTRNLVGDYYTGPLTAALHQANLSGPIAVEPVPVTDLAGSGLVSVPLANLDRIATTGQTTLRLQVSGGQPTGANFVGVAMSEHTTLPAPRLVVTLAPSSTTGCTAIPGATGPTYLPGVADVHKRLRVQVTAANRAGQVAQISQETESVATDDTTPPETSIASGPSQGSTTGPGVEFALTASEPAASFECRLDSGAFASCSPRGRSLGCPDRCAGGTRRT